MFIDRLRVPKSGLLFEQEACVEALWNGQNSAFMCIFTDIFLKSQSSDVKDWLS